MVPADDVRTDGNVVLITHYDSPEVVSFTVRPKESPLSPLTVAISVLVCLFVVAFIPLEHGAFVDGLFDKRSRNLLTRCSTEKIIEVDATMQILSRCRRSTCRISMEITEFVEAKRRISTNDVEIGVVAKTDLCEAIIWDSDVAQIGFMFPKTQKFGSRHGEDASTIV